MSILKLVPDPAKKKKQTKNYAKEAVCQEFSMWRLLLVSKTTVILLDTLDAYKWSSEGFSCFVPVNFFEFRSK